MAPALFPRKLVWFYKLMVKRLQRAEVIITISEFSKKDIIAYTGIPASRVRVIYLGVESHFAPLTSQPALADILSRYELKPKQFVLYVGNTMPHKNVRRTAEAVKIVRCKYPGIVLAVAGARDRYRADLEKAVMDMGVSDGVRFLGPIPEDELPLLYNAAAVFIFPSLYEGFGLPVLEAMACGTPVVTSNAASLPEVVGDAAITIDPRSSEAIATAVQSVLEDPCLAAELSRRGVERARGFSWKRAAEQHLSVYREVLR
jgi:glycosyltransferase involved in cell wall biosynthesis